MLSSTAIIDSCAILACFLTVPDLWCAKWSGQAVSMVVTLLVKDVHRCVSMCVCVSVS